MDRYEMLVENSLTDGIFAIGIVEDEAIGVYEGKTDFVLLSTEKQKISFDIKLSSIDKKKKIVCGPILIPDLVIPRKEFEIIFSKDTIKTLSENFLTNNNQNNITINHEFPVNNIKMVESWIIEDPIKDKSSVLGFDLPVGTWMGSYKILDDEIWQHTIETGILKGFSIEGRFTHKKVEMSVEKLAEITENEDIIQIYLAVKYSKYDLDENFVWRTAKTDINCPSCKSFDGKIKKLSEWILTAIPGVPENMTIAGEITKYPHSPYGTFCEGNCKCTLNKIVSGPRSKIPTTIEYK